MKKMNKVRFVILAAGLLFVGLMSGTDAPAADKNACAEDIAKFCQGIKPGAIPLMDCLEKHESELSSACTAFEATMGGRGAERGEKVREKVTFRQACLNDMTKFCKDANPTQGGMLKCLNDNTKKISVSCGESVKAMMK
jgi:hypothetical protein